MTRNRDAIAALFRVARDHTSNQPPVPAVFPDQMAPIIRAEGEDRVMEAMRWGFPPPPKVAGRAITNVRNTSSSYWRAWLKPEFRCLVPATSFCEYDEANAKRPTWFALNPDRPPFAFAGIWRPWKGARGTKAERDYLLATAGSDVEEHRLFAFLTADANDLVRPVHPKAMPVVLTDPADWDTWLHAPVEVALQLQHPAPEDLLQIVATGARKDGPPV